ncbi:hypothetical protein ACOMHN_021053 [Nucella lapillus]
MVLLDMYLTLSVSVVASLSLTLGLVLVLVLCIPCFRKKRGFTNFNNSTTSLESDQGEVNDPFTLTIDDPNGNLSRSTAVTIEPLPDITSKLNSFSAPLRPRISSLGKARQDASLKLTAVHHPFPRNQIVYLKELGTGWFGKVIESDAEKITVGVPRSKVVVKVLKDDASREEKNLFFEEVAPFRLLEHSNIVRLLGQCTDSAPSLMIMEAAAYGNLKQYLCSHRQSEALLIQKKRLMQFAVDASCGLACLHRHDYLHRDLAARNCLVMSDYTLKIGDYGIADHLYKEDYFLSGGNLLPIRWMAPETLKLENGSWTSNSYTKDSDIWSLGVVLWEIATLGDQPYSCLSDDQVLHKVVVHRQVRLQEPHLNMPCRDRLYEVMQSCWRETPCRMPVDEVHGLLQPITSASGDAMATFDHKWSQLSPNQHHWSADSIDSQLASASRGDVSFLSELSEPDSLDDLMASELMHQDHSLHTTAIVHTSADRECESSFGQTDIIDNDASLGFVPTADVDSITDTFHIDSSTLPTNCGRVLLKDSSLVLESDQTDLYPSRLDYPVNGHLPSGSENSSSGFDVLESSADFDLADGKSVSDSVGTCQSSVTGDVSVDKDSSSSCEFVMISDSKDVTTHASSTDSPVFGETPSIPPSEKATPTESSPSSVSQSHSIKTSAVIETSELSDADRFTSFGTELSSLSSLVVQGPSLSSDREQAFPSFGTELSSLSSLTVPMPEFTSYTCDEGSLTGETSVSDDSSSLQALNQFQFATLTSVSSTDNQVSETDKQELPSQSEDIAPDQAGGSSSENVDKGRRAECGIVCTVEEQKFPPAGLENGESECEHGVASDSVDDVQTDSSTGREHIPPSPTDTSPSDIKASNGLSLKMSSEAIDPFLSDINASNGFSLKVSSEDNRDGDSLTESDDGMLEQLVSASSRLLSAVSKDSDSLGAAGGSSIEGESGMDSDSSSNSDSGRDYICEGSWEEQGHDAPPPSSSPTSSVDSEEYALQIASEIYLSKGLKMGRPFESTFLEPIPEDPLPSISEESVAPVPSECSSVDVKFDEVFEWDDFMGEPLVGKERTSPEAGSPRESFDMSDWMLDMESDSLPSATSSLTCQPSADTPHKETNPPDLNTAVTSDSPFSQSSTPSDSDSSSHSRTRNHRSYISDLLSNRTKGVSSLTSHSLGGSSKFYSLYEEEFDLESDSQSEGGGSPPAASFLSGSPDVSTRAEDTPVYAEHHLQHSPTSLQADSRTMRPSEQDYDNDRPVEDSSDESVETDPPPLD